LRLARQHALRELRPPQGTPHSSTQFLVASVQGGTFAWTSFPPVPHHIVSGGSTLYVVAPAPAACGAPNGTCRALCTGANHGATRSYITTTYHGNSVETTALAADSGALFGYDARAIFSDEVYPLLRSDDGGHSWRALPPQATALAESSALIALDG